jgi:hypothetical protein
MRASISATDCDVDFAEPRLRRLEAVERLRRYVVDEQALHDAAEFAHVLRQISEQERVMAGRAVLGLLRIEIEDLRMGHGRTPLRPRFRPTRGLTNGFARHHRLLIPDARPSEGRSNVRGGLDPTSNNSARRVFRPVRRGLIH